MPSAIAIDGRSLTLSDCAAIAAGTARCTLAPGARRRMARAAAQVADLVGRDETVYGVTTGFGRLASVRIAPADVRALQVNLLRSHAAFSEQVSDAVRQGPRFAGAGSGNDKYWAAGESDGFFLAPVQARYNFFRLNHGAIYTPQRQFVASFVTLKFTSPERFPDLWPTGVY